MKKLLMIAVMFTACSKTDVKQPRDVVSGQSTDNGNYKCVANYFSPSENVYPHTEVKYFKGCPDEFGNVKKGTKYIETFLNVKTAPINAPIYTVTWGADYTINGARTQGSTAYQLKDRSSKGLITYEIKIDRTDTYPDKSVQTKTGTNELREINDTVTVKTGTTTGKSIIEGKAVATFTTYIDNDLVQVDGFSYVIKGKLRVVMIKDGKKHIQIINYGNGEKDNLVTESIDGSAPVQKTLPLDVWGSSIED